MALAHQSSKSHSPQDPEKISYHHLLLLLINKLKDPLLASYLIQVSLDPLTSVPIEIDEKEHNVCWISFQIMDNHHFTVIMFDHLNIDKLKHSEK